MMKYWELLNCLVAAILVMGIASGAAFVPGTTEKLVALGALLLAEVMGLYVVARAYYAKGTRGEK